MHTRAHTLSDGKRERSANMPHTPALNLHTRHQQTNRNSVSGRRTITLWLIITTTDSFIQSDSSLTSHGPCPYTITHTVHITHAYTNLVCEHQRNEVPAQRSAYNRGLVGPYSTPQKLKCTPLLMHVRTHFIRTRLHAQTDLQFAKVSAVRCAPSAAPTAEASAGPSSSPDSLMCCRRPHSPRSSSRAGAASARRPVPIPPPETSSRPPTNDAALQGRHHTG